MTEGTSQSVGRMCDMLDHLAATRAPVPLKSMLRDLGLARSTAYDLLHLLARSGHVVHGRGQAGLGPALWPAACAYLGLQPIAQAIDPALETLSDRTQETAQLSVLHQGQVLVVRAAAGSHPMRVPVEVGRRFAVNWTAAGPVLLGGMSGRPLDYFLTANARPSPTGRAELQIPGLAHEVRAAAESGFCAESGRAIEHAGSIAVPVRGRDGSRLAALALHMPEQRLQRDCATLVKVLEEAAARL